LHSRHSAVTQQSGDSGLNLNIWQRVIKKYIKNAVIHAISYQGSEQYVSVGALENINWFGCNEGGCSEMYHPLCV